MTSASNYRDQRESRPAGTRRILVRPHRRRELEPLDLRTPSGRRLPY
ncbi:MAG TPA: hypothetical protein VFN97_25150 [Actinospica sp.]|nr:hypothetical protein [Actinospica sp.]